MAQARAARALVESQPQHKQEELAMAAFLGIFHPELTAQEVRELTRE